MTDRLMTLLRGEVDTLEVPPAPASEILADGRLLRRHRRWTRTAAATSVAVVVAVATVGAIAARGGHPSPDGPATSPDASPEFAWAVGDTVYLGDGSTKVQLPEVAQSLYDTSAGLLVRTNKDGSSDGGAPFHFELVTADGAATRLGVTLGEVTPSTDPGEPYLAWATMSDGRIQVVVHDLRTDRDVATVDVPGAFSWGGWEAPPVALVGDHVYVGTDHTTAVVDWRTGEASVSDTVPGSLMPEVHGSHAIVPRDGSTQVVDVSSGRVLLDVPTSGNDYVFVQLSPDGRFATTSGGIGPDTTGAFKVYDLEHGTSVDLAGSGSGYGWTPDGEHLFSVAGHTLTTCDAVSGDCHDSSVPELRSGSLARLPGVVFES